MRYVVDENNYVKAISFGTIMEYNECVCVEYAGSVPSGWNDLEAWYFDEGNKLWRWQIVDGELVMDESATAPQEGNWMGVVISDPVFVTTPSGTDSEAIVFDLPGGTKNLRCFFVLPTETVGCEYDHVAYCVAVRGNVDDDVTDAVFSYRTGGNSKDRASGAFEISDNSIKIKLYNFESVSEGHNYGAFRKNTEYALYPFYSR